MQTFPNLHLWVALLAQRDRGVLTCFLMAAVVVLFLCDGRFFSPKHMKFYRAALLSGFWISFGVMAIQGIAR